MLDLYTWGTPNGLKPIVLLEELGVPYELKRINIAAGEQRAPDYLAINPNGKIPAMVDGDAGVTLFESGAILHYLAEKHGRFLPTAADAKARTMAWLFFQVGAVGPMFGQAGHFASKGDDQAYAKQRYTDEVKRIYGVLDQRLGEAKFLAGDEYTIADIATFTWVRKPDYFGLTLDTFPHVARWVGVLGERPAVQRALAVKFG
jgi:GST-like protein